MLDDSHMTLPETDWFSALDADWVEPSRGSTAGFIVVALGVLTAFVVGVHVATARSGNAPRRAGWRALAGAAAWVGLSGAYVGLGGTRAGQPGFLLFFAGSNIAALALAWSPLGARLSRHLPLAALVGFHVFRLPLELVLHRWHQEGALPIQMTYEGHNFDIVTGCFALAVVGVAAVRRGDIPRTLAWAFNVVGTALLVTVIAIVMRSSPLPLKSYPGPPILLGFHLPYAWIAPVCVAGALSAHLMLWRRLLTRAPQIKQEGV